MTGQAEVHQLKQRLDATFNRVKDIGQDAELQSDFAKYLCVLVSGYIERALIALVLEHARKKGAPTLQRFVEQRTKKFTNANAERILQLLGDFNSGWRQELENILLDEQRAAVDSVVNLRNTIAHGGSPELTYSGIADYYKQAQYVIDQVAKLCIPSGAGAAISAQRYRH